jgi:hypothetical protein
MYARLMMRLKVDCDEDEASTGTTGVVGAPQKQVPPLRLLRSLPSG